jgi:aminopeptidase N
MIIQKRILFICFFSFGNLVLSAQWLSKQNLVIKLDIDQKKIEVQCLQVWPAQKNIAVLLHQNFKIDSIVCNGKKIGFARKDSLLTLGVDAFEHQKKVISFYYHGKPKEAVNPPWDGGFVWKKDINGKPFISTAMQDIGAYHWFPIASKFDFGFNNSVVTCTYPKDIFFKGNGRLIQDFIQPKQRTTSWETKTPISAYNICLNIGDFVHLSDTLSRIDNSILSLDYYPLSYNKEKATKQFEQVKPMLNCFEKYFGEFPAQKDGYSIVETPFVGMEHQSAIAYGNKYQNGYNGADYSGIGLNFDFIVIHESGHEWWGNSVKACNPEDFWLQEAFCTYAEFIYVKCLYNDSIANKYINHKRTLVTNSASILSGNKTGIDMYSKGALMIRSLQNFCKTEEDWFRILKQFAIEHKHKCISTEELITWWSRQMKIDFKPFFKQYLETTMIPELVYSVEKKKEKFIYKAKFNNVVDGFSLPVIWSFGTSISKTIYLNNQESSFELDVENAEPNTEISFIISLK